MQGGVSGFQNAPVTRAVVLASSLLSVVFSAQRRVCALGLSYQELEANAFVKILFMRITVHSVIQEIQILEPGHLTAFATLASLLVEMEPRGFAFVEFVDPFDASEAQYRMNRKVFFGREITVVLAAESRKRPEEMRSRTRVRGYSGHEGRRSSHYGRSRSRSRSRSHSPRYRGRPQSRSSSPAPRRRDYSASPQSKETHNAKSPMRQPKDLEDKKQRSYSPASRDGEHHDDNGYEKRLPPSDRDGSPRHRRSPRQSSGSPPGSRSRSADGSPAHSD